MQFLSSFKFGSFLNSLTSSSLLLTGGRWWTSSWCAWLDNWHRFWFIGCSNAKSQCRRSCFTGFRLGVEFTWAS